MESERRSHGAYPLLSSRPRVLPSSSLPPVRPRSSSPYTLLFPQILQDSAYDVFGGNGTFLLFCQTLIREEQDYVNCVTAAHVFEATARPNVTIGTEYSLSCALRRILPLLHQTGAQAMKPHHLLARAPLPAYSRFLRVGQAMAQKSNLGIRQPRKDSTPKMP
ncbi:hypothetical protein K469DRAFT_344172 [Zopfia rhizophila CBS 207.26]|uniref:Uncharacterized protein n=1 Tax=Zopfia rhizophila CBS 207.26 TaxID=1314779 RepID=A0A6A6EM65_9PEZI|nr:hypothetical protein K469DRAFT_344172 [Zopfia rhizophila CBS 207.26]